MTLGEITAYVADRMGVADMPWERVVTTRALVNAEYRRLVAEERLNVTQADVALTAGDPLASLPADWQETVALRAGTQTLIPVTPMQFIDLESGDAGIASQAGDTPLYYRMEGPSKIRLWPTPGDSSATGLRVTYVARPAALAADSDTPSALPAEWHDVLAELVVARLAASDGEMDRADAARAIADGLRGRLVRQTATRGGSTRGRIRLRVYG